MVKGIAHFLFCLRETTRLRKREGGSGKARGMSGEELVSLCRRHVGHSISPHMSPVSPPLCSSHFCSRQLCTGTGRQHLTSGHCACPAFCPASLPLPPGKPPEVYSITKEPKTYHPLGLPFTIRKTEMRLNSSNAEYSLQGIKNNGRAEGSKRFRLGKEN